MIRSKSPYYIDTPWVDPTAGPSFSYSYLLNIRIWSGASTSPPAQPTEQLEVINYTNSSALSQVDISPFLRDYARFNPTSSASTALIPGNNQYWVQTQVAYRETIGDDYGPEQQAKQDFFLFGYNTGLEERNYTGVPARVLLSGDQFQVPRSGGFVIPVDGSLDGQVALKSFPNLELNEVFSFNANNQSSSQVRYLWVDTAEVVNDDSLEFEYSNVERTVSREIRIVDECRYTPVQIAFVNRWGALQLVTFFKKQIASIDVTRQQYERLGQFPSNGDHQFTPISVEGKESFTLNTGFFLEGGNDTIRELLLSEQVWIYRQPQQDYTPVNVLTSNTTFKTRNNDRLVEYTVRFEFAFNTINNV